MRTKRAIARLKSSISARGGGSANGKAPVSQRVRAASPALVASDGGRSSGGGMGGTREDIMDELRRIKQEAEEERRWILRQIRKVTSGGM